MVICRSARHEARVECGIGTGVDGLPAELAAVNVRFEETTEPYPGFRCVRAL